MRSLRLPTALLCALITAVGALGAGPAQADTAATVSILTPEAGARLSGTITVSFRVTIPPGSQPQSSYRVYVGQRMVVRTGQGCASTCDFTVTMDSTTSPFPSYRGPSSTGQIDDGPQQVLVESRDGSSILLGRAVRDVVVDNGRPTLTVSGPDVPAGVTDGRRTADASLRLEVVPHATAPATIDRVEATVRRTGNALTVLPPAGDGQPWVLQADTSAWDVGPVNIDVVAFDSLGMRSAFSPFDVMVLHGFSLWGPTIESPVWDDDLTSIELVYGYPQYVSGSWPVEVTADVDGAVTRRHAVTEAERTARPGKLLVDLGDVLGPGAHVVELDVRDNRGFTERFETAVDVRSSAAVTWAPEQWQQPVAGRPFTVSARATIETGEITGWWLYNADRTEVLATGSCTATCSGAQSIALTFTPRTAGPLDLRLEVYLGPAPRRARAVTSTVTVLPAPGDFSGDRLPDVLARDKAGQLLLYRGNGKGGWLSPGTAIGKGWQGFSAIVSNGDHSGDLRRDVMARGHAGQMYLYRANGTGGWSSGGGEPHNYLVVPGYTVVSGLGDFDGDRLTDIVARDTAGRLFLYRGYGGYVKRTQIGSGWQGFTSIFSPGDFDGDGASDIMARAADGRLLLYRGNGRGGWAAAGTVVGRGWAAFTALTGIGDFDGDGRRDVLARHSDGRLLLYRGNGAGGWAAAGYAVGRGWQGFTAVVGVG